MWRLHRASPFQTSLIRVCPLLRFPHPGDYPWLHKACPALGGLTWSGMLWGSMLGCKWRQTHGLQANVPQHRLCRCRVLPKLHRHSISCDQAWLPPCISRRYRCQESPLVGESQLNPPLTEWPPRPVKPLKIAGGSRPEDGVTGAGQPVTPGVHEEQHQMFPHLPPQKSLHLKDLTY